MKGFMSASVQAKPEDLKRANKYGNIVAGIVIGFFLIVLVVIVL